jgi:hypothetical protein
VPQNGNGATGPVHGEHDLLAVLTGVAAVLPAGWRVKVSSADIVFAWSGTVCAE